MSIISVKNLSIGYDNVPVKEGISFDIEKGDYFCIVGANGCGKSTLMKTLLGINKKLQGEIIFDSSIGKNEISYISQSLIVAKDFPATVEEIVLSGFLDGKKNQIYYTKEQKKVAIEKMNQMGISEFAKKSFNELSGGQKQRVLLARALVSSSAILFLDEPITGLDFNIVKELYDIVYNLNRKYVLTIVMISHDMDMVKKYATKVVKLDE